jgi:hypothetical protein
MMLGRCNKRKSNPNTGSRQEGSLAVESALILPVLLAAVAATIVMGLRLSDHLFLVQGARELAVILGRVPYLAALKGPGGEAQYTISLTVTGDQTADAGVTASQLTALTNGSCGSADTNYSSCTTAARGVTLWYAKQVLLIKRMMVNDALTMNVRFGPPAADLTAQNGLCMVHLTVSAQSRGWLSWATGSIVVSQSAPYVSAPVPNAGLACSPS